MFQSIKRRPVVKNFSIFLTRQLRSIAKREKHLVRSDSLISAVKKQNSKLLEGTVVAVDKNVSQRFDPVKDRKDLDNMLKKIFNKPDEVFDSVLDDGSQHGAIPNRHQVYETKLSMEKERTRMMNRQIIKRTYFKDPPETNLLTYAAKTQMRYLHRLDPEEWTAEKLAESFPASILSIKKMIKWNPPAMPDERIKVHDEIVAKRWKALKSNGDLSDFSPVTLRLWREGKLLQDFYTGNVNLPQPPKREINLKSRRIGEYGAMVKKYADYQKDKKEKALQKTTGLSDPNSSNDLQDEHAVTKSEKQMLHELVTKYPKQSEVEDVESASYLAADRSNPMEPDILPDQFEENLMEELAEKHGNSPTDQAYIEWMKKRKVEKVSEKHVDEVQPYDARNFACTVKKFNFENTIELSHDQTGSKSNVGYLYDSNKGYQHPFGREVVQDRIKIPRNLFKKGATYKVGLCFYDEQGKFMYKLPAEINTDFA